jgi:hypothetical protein
MAFDLTTAKTRLSITGATQDTVIQASLNAALSLAERYCDRLFMYGTQRATFYHVDSERLQLRRFPVDQEIKFEPSGVKHHIHKVQGIVILDADVVHEEVHVDYSGGYRTLPDDLELALWMIFDEVWKLSQSSSSGGGGGAGQVSGDISRITLQDVGSITYSTGGGGAGAAVGGTRLAGDGSPVPFTALSILDLYRVEVC